MKPVKVAILGEGRTHGEDDAISMRPYKASLVCSKNDSELLILTREQFWRIFKNSPESWKAALK